MIEADLEESYLDLCNRMGDLIDATDLNNSDTLKAVASVVIRLLAYKTEDRSSAYELRDLFCGTVAYSLQHMDEAGMPAWSKSRMN